MAVNGSQVRIGINAPRNIAVDREEIAERKRRDREALGAKPAAPKVMSSKAVRRDPADTPEG
jgi:carbon storage regulator CsrA